MKKVLPIPESLAGGRFDVGLSRMLGISRAAAGALIESGEAGLGRPAKKSEKLDAKDVLMLELAPRPRSKSAMPSHLEVLYEDRDIVVVNKPASFASHPSAGWKGETVTEALENEGVAICAHGPAGHRGVVSRLDVGTSGAMLLCKSNDAYAEMKRQFLFHEVEKTYHALANGYLEERATIDAPIARSCASKFKFGVFPFGKDAVTHYETLKIFKGFTLVEVKIDTGRTHQIRVHFSSIRHPLAGDSLYGSNPKTDGKLGLHRQWLHSKSLRFRHPTTRVWMEVDAPYPQDLQEALEILAGDRIK